MRRRSAASLPDERASARGARAGPIRQVLREWLGQILAKSPRSRCSRCVGATTSESPTLEAFVTNGEGNITIGAVRPIPCVAIASDDHNMVVAIVRRPGASLASLLGRPDHRLARVIEHDEFVGEIIPLRRSGR